MTDEKPEQSTEEKPPEEPAGSGAVAKIEETVRAVLAETLGKWFDSGKAEVVDEAEERPKRRSYRDEEDDTRSTVEKMVKELVAKERKAAERHDDSQATTEKKAAPEPVPAQPRGRRIERVMGW